MKTTKIQLQDINGKIIEENDVAIGSGETLIMHYPKDMALEDVKKCFDLLTKGIENNKTIGLPDSISFKVVKSI